MELREMRVEASDGFPLAVQLGGPADGRPLFLVQGQANSHVWWDRVRPDFEDEFLTVTMDYRGTGASRGPVESWSTAGFAADVLDVVRALGIGRAHVYGTSMGGRTAQMLAARHPEAVDRLVLACTAAGGRTAVLPDRETTRELVSGAPEERRRFLHGLFFTPDRPFTEADTRVLGDPTMTSAEAVAHRRASARHDATGVLGEIAAPTLVMHGTEDRMTPAANAEILVEGIPGARLWMHDGGRHGFFDEFRDEVNAEIRRFLDA